jgi:hypothetical protein
VIAVLLLVQGLALDEDRAAPLEAERPRFLAATAQGRTLLVGEAGRVRVLDGETLATLDTVDFEATAAGSDAQERHLYLVGTSVLRIEARFRKESLRVELPEAALEKEPDGGLAPLQAALGPDGRIYYRGTDDRLLAARWDGEHLSAEEHARPRRFRYTGSVRRVLGTGTEGAVLIADGSIERGGVALPERGIFSLAGAYGTLGAGVAGPRALVVGREGESLYDTTSWRVQWERAGQETTSAAFDPKNGWAFAAGPSGLRAIRISDPEKTSAFEGLAGLGALAVDGLGRRLYAVQGKTIRSWKIRS